MRHVGRVIFAAPAVRAARRRALRRERVDGTLQPRRPHLRGRLFGGGRSSTLGGRLSPPSPPRASADREGCVCGGSSAHAPWSLSQVSTSSAKRMRAWWWGILCESFGLTRSPSLVTRSPPTRRVVERVEDTARSAARPSSSSAARRSSRADRRGGSW